MNNELKELVFTDDRSNNWLFEKYYCAGSNSRYWTFQMALNLLVQRTNNPVIVETGCQRMADDLGAGMSTSIFGEYCRYHGGKLYTIDVIEKHLEVCKECTETFASNIEYVLSDSISWLRNCGEITVDLLYLDSLDYPISLDGTKSTDPVGEAKAQNHCLNEFRAAEQSRIITSKTIVLIDDNQLPGGGKPKLLKEYLCKNGYICLFDLQQSLWIKG
jgi:hypothetical protein